MKKMKHRISTGVLIFEDEKILLIKHVDPETGFTWWVPPGGGVKGKESIIEAAKREVFEESGLHVEIGRIIYIKQLLINKKNKNQITLYLLAETIKGKITTKNLDEEDQDSKFIKEAKYFSEKEIQSIKVFPEALKKDLWKDKKQGFPDTKFLGVFEQQI